MIVCYACNEWKPGDVALFAICDDCKSGTVPPPNIRNFWIQPPEKQARLIVQYGEPPKPFTQEELDEMADCGC